MIGRMGWFDVATAPDGRAYGVAAYPTGTTSPPGVARRGTESMLALPWPLDRVVNRVVFRGTWTVRVGPWGRPGARWSHRLPDKRAAEDRARELFDKVER